MQGSSPLTGQMPVAGRPNLFGTETYDVGGILAGTDVTLKYGISLDGRKMTDSSYFVSIVFVDCFLVFLVYLYKTNSNYHSNMMTRC